MRLGRVSGLFAAAIVGLVVLMVLSGIPAAAAAPTPSEEPRQAGGATLLVGGQDEMKVRNWLPPRANDVWTADVLFRAYDSVLQGHPTEDRLLAWIAKGVDFNENGIFEASEYNVFAETAGASTPLEITFYYDFNGVRWHDGTQMTPWDLFFSSHVTAMCPRCTSDFRALYTGGSGISYDAGGRQLNIVPVDLNPATPELEKNWEGESAMAGDANLRVAVEFTLTEPFALFYESAATSPVMMPIHLWAGTGGGKHADLKCAVWLPPSEATARGAPQCGNADPTKWGRGIPKTDPQGYDFEAAAAWTPGDRDVVGHGPFKFDTWISGVEAKVVRNDDFYTGIDAVTGTVYDAQLAATLPLPTIDGIRFKVYRTTQLGVFALLSGEIDFYHWNVGAEFVPDLLKDPNIAVESNAEPGFFYLAYNMRKAPWGYRNNVPTDDVGLPFRQAVSHMIDKKSIVQNLLQNFGVIGHGTVSPANTFWYNDNIPKPEFDLTQARAILDSPEALAVGITADPPGACSRDTPTACRSVGVWGTNLFEILTPQADYDPVRAAAGAMIADAMRQAGLNAASKPTAFGEIVNRITVHDFDLYILGWRIGGTDPDYLFNFFHSSQAAAGQNYPGFNNAQYDQVIDDSRRELDRTTRRALIFQAQLILAEQRPYDVLYYRTNIEGYRQDRFVNWTVASGSIWNFWSLQGVQPPSVVSMRATISVESATQSGATETITVTVLDNEARALQGASVELSVDAGSVSIGACTATTCTGTTDVTGVVRSTFRAPDVTAESTVIIQATARHPDFTPITRNAVIRVFPLGAQFLSLKLELPVGDRVTAGQSVPMSVTVRDQDRALASDATVQIASEDPNKLTPNPASGTAADVAQVTLGAAATITAADTLTITVTATRAGFTDALASVDISVVPTGEATRLCPDGSRRPLSEPCPTVATPGLDVLPILAGIGIAALVAGVVARRKKRS